MGSIKQGTGHYGNADPFSVPEDGDPRSRRRIGERVGQAGKFIVRHVADPRFGPILDKVADRQSCAGPLGTGFFSSFRRGHRNLIEHCIDIAELSPIDFETIEFLVG